MEPNMFEARIPTGYHGHRMAAASWCRFSGCMRVRFFLLLANQERVAHLMSCIAMTVQASLFGEYLLLVDGILQVSGKSRPGPSCLRH